MKTVHLATVLALLCTVHSKPTTSDDENNYGPLVDADAQNDNPPDYYDEKGQDSDVEKPEDYEPEDNKSPLTSIVTKGMVFLQYQNDTVVLPCEINGSDYVLMWRKNSAVLFQADVKVAAPENVEQTPDGSLLITNFQKSDEGSYECKAMNTANNSPQITHQLKMRSAAAHIDVIMAQNNVTVLKAGETLVLTCRASGKPHPHVSWHKGPERLGFEGETLTITNIKHHDAGLYRCLADNKVEDPDHAEIEIKVEFKPMVTIEKIAVNSDKNFDTELKCIVHSEPKAPVVWKKEGQNIINSDHTQLTNKGHNHILLIKGLQESDFGNYTCSATNYIGTTTKGIKLVKTPAVLRFIKPSKEDRDVVLTWEVQSKSPISRHEIEYRKNGSTEWEKINPEVSNAAENDIYTVKYKLKELGPGQYQTRIRSENSHGWSEYSDTMVFEGEKHITPTEEPKQDSSPPHNEVPAEHQSVGENQSAASQPSGCSSTTSTMSVISVALIIFVYNRP